MDNVPLANSLLQRVAANDASAVSAVLETYGGLVWSLARRFSLTSEDAEDAVQEVFLDVWKSAARFDPTVASEATFIAMIARRRLIDRTRRQVRRTDTYSLPDAAEAPVSAGGISRAESRDDASRAMEALSTLSQEQQRVLRLSIYYGLSHEEIAKATGLPLGTVKTHARRGLIRVRELLEVKESPRPMENLR